MAHPKPPAIERALRRARQLPAFFAPAGSIPDDIDLRAGRIRYVPATSADVLERVQRYIRNAETLFEPVEALSKPPGSITFTHEPPLKLSQRLRGWAGSLFA
jgi:hypothetical protein